jgi:hypothetical protein
VSFKLEVHFRGLCLFHPYKPSGKDAVDVFFNEVPAGHEEHIPRLSYQTASIIDASAWDPKPDPWNANHRRTILLATDAMYITDKLDKAVSGAIKYYGNGNSVGDEPTTRDEERYFTWLPPMSKLYKKPNELKRPKMKSNAKNVKGRIRLVGGELSTVRVWEDRENKHPRVVDFYNENDLDDENARPVHSQAIAHELAFTVAQGFDDEVRIHTPGRATPLRLKPAPGSNRVVVIIENNPDNVDPSDPGDVPEDFEHVYETLDVPEYKVLPVVRGTLPDVVETRKGRPLLKPKKISFPCSGGCTC